MLVPGDRTGKQNKLPTKGYTSVVVRVQRGRAGRWQPRGGGDRSLGSSPGCVPGWAGDKVTSARIAAAGAPAHRIARAIGWLKEAFADPLRIGSVAKRVGMSPSRWGEVL